MIRIPLPDETQKKTEPPVPDDSAGKLPVSDSDRRNQTTSAVAAVDSMLISPNGSAIRNS